MISLFLSIYAFRRISFNCLKLSVSHFKRVKELIRRLDSFILRPRRCNVISARRQWEKSTNSVLRLEFPFLFSYSVRTRLLENEITFPRAMNPTCLDKKGLQKGSFTRAYRSRKVCFFGFRLEKTRPVWKRQNTDEGRFES